MPFEKQLDLSEINFWGEHPFKTPVDVIGNVTILPERYMLDYTVSCVAEFSCARCLSELNRRFNKRFSHILKEKTEDSFDEDYVPISGDKLDIDSLVGADLLLSLEPVMLCDDDCKGLCQKCGTNLNTQTCDCKNEENLDPRFDELRKLLSGEPTN